MPDAEQLDAELLEELDAYGGPPEGEAADTMEPANDAAAAEMLRWLRGVRRERARIAAVAKAEMDRIREWAADRSAGLAQRDEQLSRALEAWTRQALKGQKRRSVPLPYGTLKLRQPQVSVEFPDNEAFIAWCQENERADLLKLSESKSAVSDALKKGDLAVGPADDDWTAEGQTATTLVGSAEGEAVPGVRLVVPSDDTFSIELPL